MEGLVRDRLAYCENCQTMRAFFEADVPPIPGEQDTRHGTDYVCVICLSIIATFQTVTPEEFKTAAQDIEDDDLKKSAQDPRNN